MWGIPRPCHKLCPTSTLAGCGLHGRVAQASPLLGQLVPTTPHRFCILHTLRLSRVVVWEPVFSARCM